MPAAKPPKPTKAHKPTNATHAKRPPVKRRQKLTPIPKQNPPPGRPTNYRKEFAEQARKLALLGKSDAEIADFLHIGKSTLCLWKKTIGEFMNALEQGRTWAGAEVVHSLYQRAIGCSVPEIHVSNHKGDITLTEIKRYYPPEIQAIKYWLNNRFPELWRDRVEVKEDIDLHVFPERETLEGVYTKIIDERQQKEARLAGRVKLLEQLDEDGGHDD